MQRHSWKRIFAEDADAIRWLKENIQDSPVVLEANGDSYSDYERVSAMTGLPTVMGWYVHEWLWRNDVADLNAKIRRDTRSIYTSTDESESPGTDRRNMTFPISL